jgi:hypothetical protein
MKYIFRLKWLIKFSLCPYIFNHSFSNKALSWNIHKKLLHLCYVFTFGPESKRERERERKREREREREENEEKSVK